MPEHPGRPWGPRRRAAASLLAFLLLAAAVVELPRALRAADARVGLAAGMSRAERDLAPARAVNLEPALVLRAADVVPEDASYHVHVAEDFAAADPVTAEAAAPFAAYWLLPRRQVAGPAEADWILSFGSPGDMPVEAEVVEEPAEGQRLLRVTR